MVSFTRFLLPFVVSSFLWLTISAAPATDIDVMVDDPLRAGCLYDGKYYDESQSVVTKEPCLNCSCQNGALRCHLQVCPFLHDIYPPPAGCVLVERKNACCPKLHCPTTNANASRLLRKDPTGQIAAWKVREDLRKRLVKQLAKSSTDKQGCVEEGTLYAEGSAMMTSSTCEYCFCLKGKQACVKPRCAEPILEGCIPIFRDLACCPTHYDCDAAVISTANATSVVSKKITERRVMGDRVRPMTVGGIRGNDRVIDSSSTSHHQQLKESRVFRKKMLRKRSADGKKNPAKVGNQTQSEEPVTLGPDSLTDANPLSALEAIAAAASANKAIEKTASNDVGHQTADPLQQEVHHDSLAVEGSMVESRVPAPVAASAPSASTDLPEELVTSKPEEGALMTAALDEEETTEGVHQQLPATFRLDVGHVLDSEDELELEPEAAERNIEVSVSSSISSVSQSSAKVAGKEDVVGSKKVSSGLAPSVPAPPQSSGNFLPIDKTAKPDAHFVPSGPLLTEEEPLDYDYSNMELPPSLPNLEIIPFVAADAVMGVPNLEEDERLNIGGGVEQRTPITQAVSDEFSKTEYCFTGGNFYNHGELIKSQPDEPEDPCKVCRCMLGQVVCHETQCAPLLPGCRRLELDDFCCGQVVCGGHVEDRIDTAVDHVSNSTESKVTKEPKPATIEKIEEAKPEPKSTTTTTTQTPILAFSVTFPPRPSSTPPPPPPTFFSRRFTPRPTARTTEATTARSVISNKFNKPAINNLVGVGAPFAIGGLRIDSCNIYGQMYRVGRIIDELSGPCVECKCTEIGVNCVNLKC